MGNCLNKPGSYEEHQNLIQEFKYLCLCVIPNLYLFDRHVGLFYTKRGNPVRIGMPGQADVYGMILANNNLLHVELEFKTGNAVQSKEQKQWQKFIEMNNGIFLLVRNKDDVYTLKNLIQQRLEKSARPI